ncbi:hypothetical protein ACFU3O_38075 [Streptomyces antibioticus]|uniref:hypothetical protein n=1 Tax=Streptomyces antibioticus TaxID=1890 RepID=UPI00368F543F
MRTNQVSEHATSRSQAILVFIVGDAGLPGFLDRGSTADGGIDELNASGFLCSPTLGSSALG